MNVVSKLLIKTQKGSDRISKHCPHRYGFKSLLGAGAGRGGEGGGGCSLPLLRESGSWCVCVCACRVRVEGAPKLPELCAEDLHYQERDGQ